MRLIFIGAPGSGKGTQAKLITQQFGLVYISTGDIFRKLINEQGTQLCEKVKYYLNRGLLVPDDIVLNVFSKVFNDIKFSDGFVLDGFPRTIFQAEQLDIILKKISQPLDGVINLNVSELDLINRMLQRGRSDDIRETIKQRLSIFHLQSEPLKNFYSSKKILRDIDGNKSVEEVFQDLIKATKQFI